LKLIPLAVYLDIKAKVDRQTDEGMDAHYQYITTS